MTAWIVPNLWLIPAVLAHGVALLIELFAHHPSVDAVRAARLIARGHYRVRFWGGVMAAGSGVVGDWMGIWVAKWERVGYSGGRMACEIGPGWQGSSHPATRV